MRGSPMALCIFKARMKLEPDYFPLFQRLYDEIRADCVPVRPAGSA
jgi:hypothetical protein